MTTSTPAPVVVDERIVTAVGTTDAGKIAAATGTVTPALVDSGAVILNAGVATQIANPTRAMIRTIVQSLITIIPLVNIAAGILIGYLHDSDVDVPGWAFAILNGALIITGLIIGAVARLMANKTVAAFIAARLPWLAPVKTVTAS